MNDDGIHSYGRLNLMYEIIQVVLALGECLKKVFFFKKKKAFKRRIRRSYFDISSEIWKS